MNFQHLVHQFLANPPIQQKNSVEGNFVYQIWTSLFQYVVDLLPGILPNILGIIKTWDRWSNIVAVKLPDIMSGSITFGKDL